MLITRTSPISGIETSKEIDVTQDQINAWKSGELIQNAMPNLSESDREFIMTGFTDEEWSNIFPDDIEDDLPMSEDECPF